MFDMDTSGQSYAAVSWPMFELRQRESDGREPSIPSRFFPALFAVRVSNRLLTMPRCTFLH
jgi:hypothetical protein